MPLSKVCALHLMLMSTADKADKSKNKKTLEPVFIGFKQSVSHVWTKAKSF